jgi:hypothetical protein
MATTKQKQQEAEEINWDGVDQSAQDPMSLQFPLVLWRHGKAGMKQLGAGNINYAGGFFFSRDGAGADTEIEMWTEQSFEGDKGEVVGLAASVADIALVRSRKRWFKDGETRSEFRAWKDYQPGFRGHIQIVGFIRGFDSPVTFSFKGLLGQAIEAIQREHQSKVLSLINRTAPQGKGLPPYALWVRVRSGKHEKVGSGAQQSEVTMPVIKLPKSLDLTYAKSRFAGNERLARFQELYFEAAEWAREWDYAGAEAVDAKKIAHEFQKNPTGDAYNVPEFAGNKEEDDDLPF